MLRDEIAKYTELSGNDGEHTSIGIIGAYLDGYEKGLELSENKCFEGMTNGEVIQALFPNMKTNDTSVESLIGTDTDGYYVVFNRDWWNAPYKAESEDKE